MKIRYIMGCLAIGTMIALGIYDSVPRDLSNQMVYVSGISKESREGRLYYLRDMNNPKRKNYVATCLGEDCFFSENGEYLYYVDDASWNDHALDTLEYCRVAVRDLWKPQLLRETRKYTVKSNQIEKVQGEDSFLYVSKKHELVLCENGKKKELAKSVAMFDVTPNGNGVIIEAEQDNAVYYMSLDDYEMKLIVGNGYIEECEDGEECATYYEFDDWEEERSGIVRISSDGEMKEIYSMEEDTEDEIYITGPRRYGENSVYFGVEEVEWIPYKDLVKDDYIESDNQEADSLSEDEKKKRFLLEKVRKYLKKKDAGSEENYVTSLYISTNGEEGRLVSDGIIQDFSSPNLIAYKKIAGDRNQISMTDLVKRLVEKIPKVNENGTYQGRIQKILWEMEDELINPMKCYVLLDGKEVQLDVEGDVVDVQRLDENHLMIYEEGLDKKDERGAPIHYNLYVADLAGNEIENIRKIEDAEVSKYSYIICDSKCYYFNINHDFCMLQDGTTNIVIENVSVLDQVGVLEDGTLFHWSNNIMTYYGDDTVKQIEGGSPDKWFGDVHSYLSIRKNKVYFCTEGKREQEILDGYNDDTSLCVYKWQDRTAYFMQTLAK
ncbi:MAG: hypothetical protein Q4D51_00370 [Eubacteriales bacterium]|nr:hypothetical protein [Eubacteriales bacterium]